MYFHLIIKDRATFDTIDLLYCTSLVVNGTNIVATYYDEPELQTQHTGTYVFANYYVYVVPND